MDAVLRRFILLGDETYYATGGFHDFISSHDSLDAAVAEACRLESLNGMGNIGWWHVWDCVTNSVVANSETKTQEDFYCLLWKPLPAPPEVE
jgi:hypothetical protein